MFGLATHEPINNLPVANCIHGRNRLRLKCPRDIGVLIDIDLDQYDLTIGGSGDPLENWGQRYARAAPWGPEVDDDRRGHRSFEDFGFERGVCDIDWHARHDIAAKDATERAWPAASMRAW